jgi:hypothetical protein
MCGLLCRDQRLADERAAALDDGGGPDAELRTKIQRASRYQKG